MFSIESSPREERRRETLIRNYSPQAFKFFMEQRIENVMKECEQRRQRRMRLEKELLQCNVKGRTANDINFENETTFLMAR